MRKKLSKFLPEFVYGGIDGLVTTFAVVAGSVWAGFSLRVLLVLGFANLIADGFAMSVGAYLSDSSRSGGASRSQSIRVGLATFVSFVLVGLLPLMPYLLLQKIFPESTIFVITCSTTLVAFWLIGYIKSSLEKWTLLRGICETLILGVIAALIAYFLGDVLVDFFV